MKCNGETNIYKKTEPGPDREPEVSFIDNDSFDFFKCVCKGESNCRDRHQVKWLAIPPTDEVSLERLWTPVCR